MPRLFPVLFAVPLTLAIAACSAPTTSTSAGVCSAVERLAGNAGDFEAFTNAETPDAYDQALDRMSDRTRSAIAELEAIDGPAAAEATRLTRVERGLLPILDQFRAVDDQASWTAARGAYTRWYDQSVATITAVVPRLGKLGIDCK